MNRVEVIKASEFLRNPAYPLFLYNLNRVIEEKTVQMLTIEDKEKLYILQKQIQALKTLPDIFEGYSKESIEE